MKEKFTVNDKALIGFSDLRHVSTFHLNVLRKMVHEFSLVIAAFHLPVVTRKIVPLNIGWSTSSSVIH